MDIDKIKKINSKRKTTKGFSYQQIKRASEKAKGTIWFNSMIAHIMIIL